MKNITTSLAVVIFAVALTACAYAQAIEVAPGAVCTKTDPVTPAMKTAQTIKVSANIASTVTVKLSATKIDWKVTSAGNYKEPIINIVVKNPNQHDVTMHVAGAANLKNANGKAIDTAYGIAANWKEVIIADANDADFLTVSCPVANEPTYVSASNFNGAHALARNKMSTLWNRIKVDDNLPTGNYVNQFTVTFSEQL